MSDNKLPQTDSIQELAKFWDEHDLTDFEPELEEVAVPVFSRETEVRIQLPSKEAEAVQDKKRGQVQLSTNWAGLVECCLWIHQQGSAEHRAMLSAWPLPRPRKWLQHGMALSCCGRRAN